MFLDTRLNLPTLMTFEEAMAATATPDYGNGQVQGMVPRTNVLFQNMNIVQSINDGV